MKLSNEEYFLLLELGEHSNGLSVNEIKEKNLDRENSLNKLLARGLVYKHNPDGSGPITGNTLIKFNDKD